MTTARMPAKDPSDVRDYGVRYTGPGMVGRSIASSAWVSEPSGLVIDSSKPPTFGATSAAVRLGGGAADVVYLVTNHAELDNGEHIERSFELPVQDL